MNRLFLLNGLPNIVMKRSDHMSEHVVRMKGKPPRMKWMDDSVSWSSQVTILVSYPSIRLEYGAIMVKINTEKEMTLHGAMSR